LILDVGCGPNKTRGAFGVDRHAYPGVDLVCDLDVLPWPLKDDAFDSILASHVIEHVESIPAFMREVHRVGRHGAVVRIMTPHYSSNDSWQDPTHRWHLGTRWHESFCGGYLGAQMPHFEFVSVDVEFPRKLNNLFVRLLVRYRGVNRWERSRAFRSPAKNMETRLRILKN
jgi:predicted SAM-dependent methyltransferase